MIEFFSKYNVKSLHFIQLQWHDYEYFGHGCACF